MTKSNGFSRAYCPMILLSGVVVALALLAWGTTSEYGDRVTYLYINEKDVDRRSKPASLFISQRVPVGHIGRTSRGGLFCGVQSPSDESVQLWKIGDQPSADRHVEIDAKGLVALSRGARALWVAGREGLYRVANEEAQFLSGVHILEACEGPGGTGPPPPFELYTTERTSCASLAVDTYERPWRLSYGPTAVHVYVPAQNDETAGGSQWYRTGEYVRGVLGAVVALDPTAGVWVYNPVPRDEAKSLAHLDIKGSGEDTEIVELPDTPDQIDIPVLYNPRMTVGKQAGVVIAGETAEGDVLVQVREGRVRAVPIPFEISHGRRITAIATDHSGKVLLATDGAGVLVYDGRDWIVHEITEHLPALKGTGLKPVDDILVADDGKLYAAIQKQVIIWQANSEGE